MPRSIVCCSALCSPQRFDINKDIICSYLGRYFWAEKKWKRPAKMPAGQMNALMSLPVLQSCHLFIHLIMPASGTFSNTEGKPEFYHSGLKKRQHLPDNFHVDIYFLTILLISYKPFDEKTLSAKRNNRAKRYSSHYKNVIVQYKKC